MATNLTFGELRRVVAVTRVIPLVLSYTGGFHSGRTAVLKQYQHEGKKSREGELI